MGDPQPRNGASASTGPAQGHVVDYEMDDAVQVDSLDQFKALGDATRDAILTLLSERSATITQLAKALQKPKGSVGYHVKVLEGAGFIRLVRTGKVRALTEKYYGRVARTIVFDVVKRDDPLFMLNDALREARVVDGEPLPMFTMRRARISQVRAAEFSQRLMELSEEFLDLPREGDRVYGLIAGVYPTDLPALEDEDGRS